MSQLSCGECTRLVGCAWCPSPGVTGDPHCNQESSWVVTLPVRHFTVTDNTSYLEWVVPKPTNQQHECKQELYKDRSMVPKEIREFYPNNGKQFEQRNFNYDYSIPLLMNTGRKYDFQLSWNLRNLEQSKKTLSRWYRHDPEFKNLRVTIYKQTYVWNPEQMDSLITRNSGPLHGKYYEEDWKPSIPPFDYKLELLDDRIICNISLELSKCPEKPNKDIVFVFLEKVGVSKEHPLGVFSLNVETACDCKCRSQCSPGFDYFASSCNKGNMACGVCQNCPEGTVGEFCQCRTGSQPLTSLPSVEIGKKDDLVGTRAKHSEDSFSFDHAFIPIRVSPEILQCNATFCKNLNIQGCEEENRDLWDVAKDYQMVAIYGDRRLTPGAELEFIFSICKANRNIGRIQYTTRFGFGVPATQEREYNEFGYYNQHDDLELHSYWSDDIYYWRSWVNWKYDGFKYEHGLRVEKTRKDRKYDKNGEYEEYEYKYEEWEKSLLHNETFSFDLSSPIKLSVTETGVVWSWANFSHTHTVDILAKQYYPVFFLHGCQDKEEFSSVKIINSEVGN